MAETFENLEDISPDWPQDDIGSRLGSKQKERKRRFFVEDNLVEDNLENTLLQSKATKINSKWAEKLSYGESPVVCFVFNKLEQKR